MPGRCRIPPCALGKDPRASPSSSCVSVWPSWPCWSAWRLRASALVCGRRPFAPPPSSCWLACSKRVPAPSCRRGRQIFARATRQEIASASYTPSSYWRAALQTPAARQAPPVLHALPAGVVVRASRSPLRFWPDAQSASTGTLTICDTQRHRGAPRHRAEPERPPAPRRRNSRRNAGDAGSARIHADRNAGRARRAVGRLVRCSRHAARQPAQPCRRAARGGGHQPGARHGRSHSRQSARPALTTARTLRVPATSACDEASGCDSAQLAAADLAHFASAARALFPHAEIEARVEYAPATGPATPARYLITLRWSDARNVAGTQSAALQVLAQSPVAG